MGLWKIDNCLKQDDFEYNKELTWKRTASTLRRYWKVRHLSNRTAWRISKIQKDREPN